MSRIGKKPIQIPPGVELKITENRVEIKGPKGTLGQDYLPEVSFQKDGDQLSVVNIGDKKESRKFQGLYRTLVANMILGVTEGFTKRLEIRGQGYHASTKGNQLEMMVGHSHPILMDIPKGMEVKAEEKRGEKLVLLEVWGIDKQAVGQFAANIRAWRKPEPYKGKGIRYAGEVVRQKQGKKTV